MYLCRRYPQVCAFQGHDVNGKGLILSVSLAERAFFNRQIQEGVLAVEALRKKLRKEIQRANTIENVAGQLTLEKQQMVSKLSMFRLWKDYVALKESNRDKIRELRQDNQKLNGELQIAKNDSNSLADENQSLIVTNAEQEENLRQAEQRASVAENKLEEVSNELEQIEKELENTKASAESDLAALESAKAGVERELQLSQSEVQRVSDEKDDVGRQLQTAVQGSSNQNQQLNSTITRLRGERNQARKERREAERQGNLNAVSHQPYSS